MAHSPHTDIDLQKDYTAVKAPCDADDPTSSGKKVPVTAGAALDPLRQKGIIDVQDSDKNDQLSAFMRAFRDATNGLLNLGVTEKQLNRLQRDVLRDASVSAPRHGVLRAAEPCDVNMTSEGVYEGNCAGYWSFSLAEEFLEFCQQAGVHIRERMFVLPGKHTPGLYEFWNWGKKLCRYNPIIFRDMCLYHSDFGKTLLNLSTDLERIVKKHTQYQSPDPDGLDGTDREKSHFFSVGRRPTYRPVAGERQSNVQEIRALLQQDIPEIMNRAEVTLGKDLAAVWLKDVWRNPAEIGTVKHVPCPKYGKWEQGPFLDAIQSLPSDRWYQAQFVIPWSFFLYLRILPHNPMDLIFDTDDIGPKRADQVYRTIGLLAAAASSKPSDQLSVDFLPWFVDYERWLTDIAYDPSDMKRKYPDIDTPRQDFLTRYQTSGANLYADPDQDLVDDWLFNLEVNADTDH